MPPCASTAISFDHNLHALRIVEDFELRYAAFRGLNLTFEVREGIIKHSHDYRADQFHELAEYLLDHRPPLEAQLIDMADEIAYSSADLDDGFEARLLSLEEIRDGIPRFDRFYRDVEQLYPGAVAKLKFNEALKRLLDRWVGDLIRNTQEQIQAAGVTTLDDVRACTRRLVRLSAQSRKNGKQPRNFCISIFTSARRWIRKRMTPNGWSAELFGFWMAKPENLPSNYQEKAGQDPLPRVICDYIAGMTDNYIYQQYEKHCGS